MDQSTCLEFLAEKGLADKARSPREEEETFLDLANAMLVWHPDAQRRQYSSLVNLFFNQSKHELNLSKNLLAYIDSVSDSNLN